MQTLQAIKKTLTSCNDRLDGIEKAITQKMHGAYYAQMLKKEIEKLNVALYELKQIK